MWASVDNVFFIGEEEQSDLDSTTNERGSVLPGTFRESAATKQIPKYELWEEYTNSAGNTDGEQHFGFQLSRTALALQAFLGALSETNRPLVLFLDDLQWADNHSLAFISTLLTEFSSKPAPMSRTDTDSSPTNKNEAEEESSGTFERSFAHQIRNVQCNQRYLQNQQGIAEAKQDATSEPSPNDRSIQTGSHLPL